MSRVKILREARVNIAALEFFYGVKYPRFLLRIVLCALIFVSAFSLPAVSNETGGFTNDMSLKLQSILTNCVRGDVPGMVLGVQYLGKTWTGAAGFADVTNRVAAKPEMQIRIASITKTFAAFLIMQLVEEGKVSLDDTLKKWLPEIGVTNADRILIRHLLSHTAGLADYSYDDAFYNRYFDDPTQHLGQAELIQYLPLLGAIEEPGKKYSYSNMGYILLGLIAEKALGGVSQQTVTDAFQQRFLDRFNMRQSSLDPGGIMTLPHLAHYTLHPQTDKLIDASSWNLSWDWTAGSGVSTARDMLRWANAIMQGRLVSNSTYQVMTNLALPGTRYGFGLIVEDLFGLGEPSVYHTGGTYGSGTVCLAYPRSGIGFFVGVNRLDDASISQIQQAMFGGAEQFFEALKQQPGFGPVYAWTTNAEGVRLVDINRIVMPQARWASVSFAGMSLTNAWFAGMNLANAIFTGANLNGADFTGARLTDACFINADVSNARFDGADLRNAVGLNLNAPGLSLANAVLPDGSMPGLSLAQHETLTIGGDSLPVAVAGTMRLADASRFNLAGDSLSCSNGLVVDEEARLAIASGGSISLSGNWTNQGELRLYLSSASNTVVPLRLHACRAYLGGVLSVIWRGTEPLQSGRRIRVFDLDQSQLLNEGVVFDFNRSGLPAGLAFDAADLFTTGELIVRSFKIESIGRNSGGMGMTWSEGGPQAKYAIEISTNLSRWTSISTYMTNKTETFAANNMQRFYRMRLQYEPAMPTLVHRDVVYQVSLLSLLTSGDFEGDAPCGMLKRLGDIGIGTFEGLNGEMILLNGVIYRVNAAGQVQIVDDQEGTPFAIATFWDVDGQSTLADVASFDALRQKLDEARCAAGGKTNLLDGDICVVRLSAAYSYVKTRSVPKQSKPYPRLVEVTQYQPTFEYQNVVGTIVGFWFPQSANGNNLPGWHLHFLADDLSGGGHLLDCRFTSAALQVDRTPGYRIITRDDPYADEQFEQDIKEAEENK